MVLAMVFMFRGCGPELTSPVKTDETVVLFPTAGRLEPDSGHWVLPVHGWIYEPEQGDLLRSAALDSLRRALGLDPEAQASKIFLERARLLIVDNESNKRMVVALGDRKTVVGVSEANGHFEGVVRVRIDEVEDWVRIGDAPDRLNVSIALPQGDQRSFVGSVQLVGEEGLSVVSDIDDTIKVSQVRDKRALLTQTFLREFEAVEGMARLFERWRAQGAVFHYVSASPWQLYPPLADFLAREGFPAGSFHMKYFRWKDETFFNLFSSQESYKRPIIESLIKQYPKRRFVLVGDSGEQDPEIFGGLARDFPQRVQYILIRDVTGEAADAPRYRAAFDRVDANRWRIFTSADSLADLNF
jgi:phosphatidate phosphatase APP1